MAKRGGFFSTLGSLWRLTIWGLAAIFVIAFWIWYNGDEPDTTVASTDAVEDATPARAPETPESVASEESSTPEPNPAETGGAALQEGNGLEGTRPVDGANLQEQGNAATTMVEGAVVGAAQSASEAVTGAVSSAPATIPLPAPMTAIDVVGDNTATYAFVDVARGEDGAIELTTARIENGQTLYVTRRVTCDPLAATVVAEGPDRASLVQTDGLTDPMPVPEGSPEAALASYACSLEF